MISVKLWTCSGQRSSLGGGVGLVIHRVHVELGIVIHYDPLSWNCHPSSVFCIVPSLPRWSLLPQHKFEIFTFHLYYSMYASSGSTIPLFASNLIWYHLKSLYFMKSIFVGGPGLKNSRQFPLFQGVGSSEMHLNLNGTQTSCGLFSFNKWRIVGVGGRNWKQLCVTSEVARQGCSTINLEALIQLWDNCVLHQRSQDSV